MALNYHTGGEVLQTTPAKSQPITAAGAPATIFHSRGYETRPFALVHPLEASAEENMPFG